ncbi:MAG: hypothetical protein GKR91_20365 [Pseudomonadales bacterium]|nr:hypothetical protein [Pseudomonadales bacterium]
MIGGSVCLWLYNDGSRRVVQANIRYLTFGAFIGFQGALLNFLVQVGMVSGSGVMGMFDWNMASIFLDTQLGDTTFLGWLASLLFLLLVCSICKR